MNDEGVGGNEPVEEGSLRVGRMGRLAFFFNIPFQQRKSFGGFCGAANWHGI
jgi:hypothetical protein